MTQAALLSLGLSLTALALAPLSGLSTATASTAVIVDGSVKGLVNEVDLKELPLSVAGKQVRLCTPAGLAACLASLPEAVSRQLPADPVARLGYRPAMVMPVVDAQIAGVVLYAALQLPQRESAIIDGQLYELPMQQQASLTLWHEVGHLEVLALQGGVLPQQLALREQEWLADAYLYWRIAKEQGSLELAWQQFHRRNLQAVNDSGQLSHWSSLYLLPLLRDYGVQQLQQFQDFAEFCREFYPRLPHWSDAELREFAGLLQHLFQRSGPATLPDYLYWRRPMLVSVLTPTLEHLLGAERARQWLQRHHLLQDA